MPLEKVTTYAADASSRLLDQYRRLPKFSALMAAVGGLVQPVENAVFDLIAMTAINTADGVWLDYLGSVVGEDRGGAVDAMYRRFIRARIVANGSSGTIDDILAVSTAWNGASLPNAVLEETPPAALKYTLLDIITPSAVERLRRLIAATRSAGVRLTLLYQVVDDANSFCFSSTNGTPEASSAQGFASTSNPTTGGTMARAVTA